MNIEERIQYYMGKWYSNEILIDNKQIEKFPKKLMQWYDIAVLYNNHIYEIKANCCVSNTIKLLLPNLSSPDPKKI